MDAEADLGKLRALEVDAAPVLSRTDSVEASHRRPQRGALLLAFALTTGMGGGCTGHEAGAVPSADGKATVEVALAESSGAARLPSCAAHPTSAPIFDSYYSVEVGTPFQAIIAYSEDGHDWRVTPTPKILRHHATRIDWENLTQWGERGLGAARGDNVRIEFSFVSSEVKIRGEGRWTSRHVAKIDTACRP